MIALYNTAKTHEKISGKLYLLLLNTSCYSGTRTTERSARRLRLAVSATADVTGIDRDQHESLLAVGIGGGRRRGRRDAIELLMVLELLVLGGGRGQPGPPVASIHLGAQKQTRRQRATTQAFFLLTSSMSLASCCRCCCCSSWSSWCLLSSSSSIEHSFLT